MKRFLFVLWLLMAFAVVAAPAYADDAIQVTANKLTNNFRKNLLFQIEAQSASKITQVALLVQIDGLPSSTRQAPTFTPDTKIQATYTWNLGQNYMPPGISGQYWWTLQDAAGNQLTTPKQSFRMDDPAHQWQKVSDDRIALYWYKGDKSFGQALFDQANKSIDVLQQDTAVTVDRQVQILIYGNHDDLMNALSVGAQEWTGGQNFPDYGVVVIGIDPGDLDWGERATTHELTHQIIHQKIRGPLGDLSMPHWMDEGLAVYYENPGQADPQFSGPLRRAIQNNTIVPIRTLSGSFPADPSAANLAYGESWSVVDFIIRHYGREKLAALLQAFKAGGYYDDVFQKVLGVDTDGLENEWRKDVGAQPRVVPTRSTTQPTPFPTFGLSTESTPVPTTASAATVSAATATPPLVAVNATPVPVAPSGSSPSAPTNPISNVCGGVFGVMAFGILGAMVWQRRR